MESSVHKTVIWNSACKGRSRLSQFSYILTFFPSSGTLDAIQVILNLGPQLNSKFPLLYKTGKVCGLCGNFDNKASNDFTTRSMAQDTVSALTFGNSWKKDPACPDVEGVIEPCELKPHRKAWAEKECSLIKSEVFKICHHKVNPQPYYEACVHDACACDTGGDCECFCTAVAAYAHECIKADACVHWRTPDICPIFCEYYNPNKDICEWHYEPCGRDILTCKILNQGSTNFSVSFLEGKRPINFWWICSSRTVC
uniref:VWFD domain-containing protein n=1 Tax=Pseudonaja textilis TaxID=8673 RepID=A0A670ZPQ9_PSETE